MIFGDGADKFKKQIEDLSNISLLQNVKASAQFMGKKSQEKLEKKAFEDAAYFEPFYLKEFIAGTPKKIF